MGQSKSTPEHKQVPVEQVSHEIALRFAEKCYTHMEIAHFRDNFKSHADHQDDVEYWKEETLCRFLSIPNSLHAGPVIYQMATYLGSFPFLSLAPSILTREAMIKVVTILTGRYRKVLKRGDHDKNKLLYRSIAVFDRRLSATSPVLEKPRLAAAATDHAESTSDTGIQTRSSGFAVDDPLNDDEEEDDDDLALAALEALDAIGISQEDEKKEVKISRAHIPADFLHKLFMLILLFASVAPQDNLAAFSEALDSAKRDTLADAATSLIAAFDPDPISNGVQYAKFVKTVSVVLVNLFRPLSPVFEHFLFSQNIDLSKHKEPVQATQPLTSTPRVSPIHRQAGGTHSMIMNDTVLAQLSLSLEISSTTSLAASSFFHHGATFNEIYSTTSHGTSMNSFSRRVLSWRSATLLLISGTSDDNSPYLFGAYLPDHWRDPGAKEVPGETSTKAALFQLKPRHAIFYANEFNKSMPLSHFSTKTGIGLGCISPAQSRVQSHHSQLILGPVSILIDADISTATFQHDFEAGTGAFCPDPGLEEAQRSHSQGAQPRKIQIDIDALEVWGINSVANGDDEIANQRKRLAWEEEEAARRRGVNFGGDRDGARALLEMAGIVGDDATNRSGGSI